MHNHSTTGTCAGKWRGVNRDFLAFVLGWSFTCDPGTGQGLVARGGGPFSVASLGRGGGGGKSLPPRFLTQWGPTHGVHPRFVVAYIWADGVPFDGDP